MFRFDLNLVVHMVHNEDHERLRNIFLLKLFHIFHKQNKLYETQFLLLPFQLQNCLNHVYIYDKDLSKYFPIRNYCLDFAIEFFRVLLVHVFLYLVYIVLVDVVLVLFFVFQFSLLLLDVFVPFQFDDVVLLDVLFQFELFLLLLFSIFLEFLNHVVFVLLVLFEHVVLVVFFLFPFFLFFLVRFFFVSLLLVVFFPILVFFVVLLAIDVEIQKDQAVHATWLVFAYYFSLTLPL
mmetsp:Transcript_1710/g.2879  ORF Transcript_1710/g.2879 Transcript_1710/m.2879 type:complete len:235 (-) Transcript_1710:281-985(-)